MFEFLRRYFGTENISEWEFSDIKVLLYLGTHRKEDRLPSAEKLGKELGIAEGVVPAAFSRLRRRGCLFPPPEAGTIRDPREVEVTWRGRRALRPFLNAFGYGDVVILTLFAFGLGGVVGLLYSAYQLYPSYFVTVLLVAAIITAVLLGFAAHTARMAMKSRRDELDVMLRKPAAAVEERPPPE
ncbi:MAG: hypothetical protein LYZ69_03895 [Nitrososphaerales archaeon]|nr:hypothetical protein [Nitrososphaerales archaeon]